ncbi:MAG: hypothetical protein PHG67_14250 [Bacteroidales bacterium]|nr:hypothetical protein [Bacteroidales bacterium]
MKTHTIELNEKELKLLMSILEEAEDVRSSMGCNDPYDEEEKIFTKNERIKMQKSMYDENQLDDEEIDGYLSNNQYVQFIIDKINSQIVRLKKKC